MVATQTSPKQTAVRNLTSWSSVMGLDWVNLRAPWWTRILIGLDPVDLIGRMEWI